MSGVFFWFYLNSFALTFLFNSNCRVLEIPPYILQSLLFWRTEYLVVCTASDKWAACALVQSSEVCLLGGGRGCLQKPCFPEMTNCSFLHFEKMLVDSKEMHHGNECAGRLTIFFPTFTLGTAWRERRSTRGSLCACPAAVSWTWTLLEQLLCCSVPKELKQP